MNHTNNNIKSTLIPSTPIPSTSTLIPIPPYYRSQLFNELYFLVDGGSVWTDTSEGRDNMSGGSRGSGSGNMSGGRDSSSRERGDTVNDIGNYGSKGSSGSSDRNKNNKGMKMNRDGKHTTPSATPPTTPPTTPSLTTMTIISIPTLVDLHTSMITHDNDINDSGISNSTSNGNNNNNNSNNKNNNHNNNNDSDTTTPTLPSEIAIAGDQESVGQFLYLEGHEYLMYNTYDVHFYSGERIKKGNVGELYICI